MTAGRKIILIGPMGAGKTSLGRRLATRLRWEFTDTDHALCARTGVDIPTIFAAEGEAGFRKREHEMLADILAEPRDMVVASGGGIVLKAENRRLIAGQFLVVFLDVSKSCASAATATARSSKKPTTCKPNSNNCATNASACMKAWRIFASIPTTTTSPTPSKNCCTTWKPACGVKNESVGHIYIHIERSGVCKTKNLPPKLPPICPSPELPAKCERICLRTLPLRALLCSKERAFCTNTKVVFAFL